MMTMQSNLDNLFKANKNLETAGVVFDVGNGIKFTLKRFGGSNSQAVKSAMAKYHKPHARLIELDQLPLEKTTEIMVKVFVDACLVSWEGVEIDGQKADCNFDNAVKLFTSLPELFTALYNHAQGFESFKDELGNF